MTFHGLPENQRMTVNHKDGDRFNNHIYNLEWLTLAENIRHGFETGLYHTQQQITLISEDGCKHTFRSLSQASKFLGKSHGYISDHLKSNKEITDKNKKIYKVG
jgi:hypothetical protein